LLLCIIFALKRVLFAPLTVLVDITYFKITKK
jgi:hypothetical protein